MGSMRIYVCCSLLIVAACTTPAVVPVPATVAAPVAQATVPVVPDAPSVAECPIRNTVCTMDYNPMVCSAAAYAGKAQSVAEQSIAWGPNGCAAKLNLHRQICAAGLLPSKLGEVQCVPDASNGHCPPASAVCREHGQPTNCRADAYGSQHLNPDLAVKTAGASECEAKAKLNKEACRRNLDPERLAAITCSAQVPAPHTPAAVPASTPTVNGAAK